MTDAAVKAAQAMPGVIGVLTGLVPGVPGLSENIRIRSILGRHLEHSRIYYFENAGSEPVIYLGSADLMPRNYFRRIECLFPVSDPGIRAEIIDVILPAYLHDHTATLLQPDGSYQAVPSPKGGKHFSAQGYFMARAEELRRREVAHPVES